MKWIGIPLILLCAFYAGRGLYSELAERERLLSELCRFLNAASNGIRITLAPLDRIIGSSAAEEKSPEFLRVCAARLGEGYGFPEAWRAAMRDSPDIGLLRDGELTELGRLGETLGRSDVRGELALLGQSLEYFSACREVARTELREKSKMYMTCYLFDRAQLC